jgi:hypothetical protein
MPSRFHPSLVVLYLANPIYFLASVYIYLSCSLAIKFVRFATSSVHDFEYCACQTAAFLFGDLQFGTLCAVCGFAVGCLLRGCLNCTNTPFVGIQREIRFREEVRFRGSLKYGESILLPCASKSFLSRNW